MHSRLVYLNNIDFYLHRAKFNYTLKKIQNINKKAVSVNMIEQRKTYAINFLRRVNSKRNILFFDETEFNISMCNYYGKSLKGRRALKSRNWTIMVAMNGENPIYYKVLDTAGNRKNFAEYLEKRFQKLSENNLNNVVFVMDNVIFHHCLEIKTLSFYIFA